jgi:hypothetical protein
MYAYVRDEKEARPPPPIELTQPKEVVHVFHVLYQLFHTEIVSVISAVTYRVAHKMIQHSTMQ